MNEKTEMMADMVKNLAVLLTEQNREMTMEEALATVFNSETYRKVIDELLLCIRFPERRTDER